MADERLDFTDLFSEEMVVLDLEGTTKEIVLTKMATLLVESGNCKPTFVQAILDREAAHPSALPMPGIKIAIPHTDAEHVHRSAILFARLEQPVEFRSMGDPDEKLGVKLVSMFALKEKKRIGDLLETLILAYQDEELLKQLCNATTRRELFTALQGRVSRAA